MAKKDLLKLKELATDLGIKFEDDVTEKDLDQIIKDFEASATDGINDEIVSEVKKETKTVLGIDECEIMQKDGWLVKEILNTEEGKKYILVK